LGAVSDPVPSAGVRSVVASLTGFVSVLMGLAMTNTITALITDRSYSRIVAFGNIDEWSAVCSVAFIGTIVRFYHGNTLHMARLYLHPDRREGGTDNLAARGIGVNFAVIFGQSIFFALMSFYATSQREIFAMFAVLLFVDIIWYVANLQITDDRQLLEHQKRWMLNNTVFLFLILVCIVAKSGGGAADWLHAAAILMGLNTLVDFRISRDLYTTGTLRTNASSA
jgi:hypothetical protein